MDSEKTILLIKPDAVMRGIVGRILSEIEQKGFRICALKMLILSDHQLYCIYPGLKNKSFHDQVKALMQMAPCVAMVLEGHAALTNAFKLAGAGRNPEDNGPDTLRGKYALWTGADVVHRAATQDEADEQIKLLFTETDFFEYDRLDGFLMSERGWERKIKPT
jgi:nucleoside-diphosphate kinase